MSRCGAYGGAIVVGDELLNDLLGLYYAEGALFDPMIHETPAEGIEATLFVGRPEVRSRAATPDQVTLEIPFRGRAHVGHLGETAHFEVRGGFTAAPVAERRHDVGGLRLGLRLADTRITAWQAAFVGPAPSAAMRAFVDQWLPTFARTTLAARGTVTVPFTHDLIGDLDGFGLRLHGTRIRAVDGGLVVAIPTRDTPAGSPVPDPFGAPGSQVEVALSPDAIRGALRRVQNEVVNPMLKDVTIRDLTADFESNHLRVRAIADVESAPVDVYGRLSVRLFTSIEKAYDDKERRWEEYIRISTWDLQVDHPWWVDALGVFLGVGGVVAGGVPGLLVGAVIGMMLQAVSDAVLSALRHMALSKLPAPTPGQKPTPEQQAAQAAAHGLRIVRHDWQSLPGLAAGRCATSIRRLGFDPAGFVSTVRVSAAGTSMFLSVPHIHPRGFRDYACVIYPASDAVALQDPWVRVRWHVRRRHDGAVVRDEDMASRGAGPDLLRTTLRYDDPYCTGFEVRFRMYRRFGPTEQTLFEAAKTIEIVDPVDTSHPYVRWHHLVETEYFTRQQGALLPGGRYRRRRASKIHRTEPAARCRAVTPAIATRSWDGGVKYLDALPFSEADLAGAARRHVCDYCFFGGPGSTERLP